MTTPDRRAGEALFQFPAGRQLEGERRPSDRRGKAEMRIDAYEFGRITIDGVVYDHDVVIEAGRVRKRKKGPSKKRREGLGHTPLTADEEIPWGGKRLWVGTGAYGSLPVADDVRQMARRRRVDLLIKPTPELVRLFNESPPPATNLILHVTC